MSILSIELRHHRRRQVQLDNGTVINLGDRLIELHMTNAWFFQHRKSLINSANEVRWQVSTAFAGDLRYLAGQLMERGFPDEIKALHAITTLWLPAHRLGFTVTELPQSFRTRLTYFYLSGLMRVYHLKGGRFASWRRPLALKEIWMSRSRLLERYLRPL